MIQGKEARGWSCLLRVKGFPEYWTSGLTLGMSDDLGSWALWEWRGNETDSMMIMMAAWASFENSLLIYLKIFKENKTRGCLLCVVGPMDQQLHQCPNLYSILASEPSMQLVPTGPPTLHSHKRITTQRWWAWHLEAWLWGQRPAFRSWLLFYMSDFGTVAF